MPWAAVDRSGFCCCGLLGEADSREEHQGANDREGSARYQPHAVVHHADDARKEKQAVVASQKRSNRAGERAHVQIPFGEGVRKCGLLFLLVIVIDVDPGQITLWGHFNVQYQVINDHILTQFVDAVSYPPQ
jgi:hypothetical protein